MAIPLEVHFLNFKYLRGAFEHRSRDVIKQAEYILLIHDGKSKGTANEYKLVLKSGKPHQYLVIEYIPDQRNNGFNIKDDWSNKEILDLRNFEFKTERDG